MCYTLQTTGPDGVCIEGDGVEPTDPLMKDPAALEEISSKQ